MLGLGTLGKGNELLWKLVSLLQQNMKPDPTNSVSWYYSLWLNTIALKSLLHKHCLWFSSTALWLNTADFLKSPKSSNSSWKCSVHQIEWL